MKLCVFGSRSFYKYDLLERTLNGEVEKGVTLIISGGARGADKLAERYAAEHEIPFQEYPALWEIYGKSAGYIRNDEMAEAGDRFVAFWDMQSKGTEMMIRLVTKLKKPLTIIDTSYITQR